MLLPTGTAVIRRKSRQMSASYWSTAPEFFNQSTSSKRVTWDRRTGGKLALYCMNRLNRTECTERAFSLVNHAQAQLNSLHKNRWISVYFFLLHRNFSEIWKVQPLQSTVFRVVRGISYLTAAESRTFVPSITSRCQWSRKIRYYRIDGNWQGE